MSDNIDIPVTASGADGVERLVSALDRLHASMSGLANNTGLSRLEDQMKVMQASITTGFAEAANKAKEGGAAIAAAAESTSKRLLSIEQRRDVELDKLRQQALVSYVGWWDKMLDIEERRDTEMHNKRTRAAQEQLALEQNQQVKLAEIRAQEKQRLSDFNEASAAQAWQNFLKIEADKVAALEATAARARKLDEESQARSFQNFLEIEAKKTAESEALAARRLRLDEESQARSFQNFLALEAQKVSEAEALAARQARITEESQARAFQNFLEIESRKVAEAEALAARRLRLDEESQARSFQNFLALEAQKVTEAEALAARRARLDEESQARSFQNFLELESRKVAEAEALVGRTRALTEAAQASSWKNFLDIEASKEAAEATRIARSLSLQEASEAASWRNFLDIEAKKRAETERTAAAQLSAVERQRVLNTNFQTATPGAQLRTAEQAQVYAGLGGNAIERYGSAAAGADINALRAAHERLQQTVPGSTRAIEQHGDAMREAHSLARGLAGSLGGLWLTYGSLVPLIAGAAIAGSLKNVVTVGKEVENQLNFVYALSQDREGVDLNKFLTITDSSLSSIVESANAMRMLAQNGLQAGQALQVLPSLLDLATVGEMTVGQAALAVTGATSAFGLHFSEAGRVADIFARTAANSNTSVVALTESMKQASTSASLFHVSIEETAAVLGTLAKINITGGAAGTAMTNMLTGLYEPTEKAKKALKEIGLETKTASGALKPFTEVMEELRMRLAGYNDSAKVDILGSIFTARGVKAVTQVQENLGEYTKKIAEATTATGFMRSVVEQLENSTDGAFKRLGVTVQNSLVRSFAEANPYVQQLGLHLGDIFKKGSAADTGLQNFATNVARMTGAVVENGGAVGTAAALWMSWRLLLAPLVPLMTAYSTAVGVSTTASLAAAAASTMFNTAQVAGTATTAMYTTAIEAQAVATVAATEATAAWRAMILPFLGALAVAIAAAAALWLIFRDNTDKVEQGNVKLENSLHVINEALQKEEERLKRVIDLWDQRNMKFRDEKSVTPADVEAGAAQVAAVEAKIRAEGKDPNKIRQGNSGLMVTQAPMSGISVRDAETVSQWSAELRKADEIYAGLTASAAKFENVIKPQQEFVKTINLQNQTREEIEKFFKLSEEKNSKGDLYQKNPEILEVYKKAKPLLAQLQEAESSLAGMDPLLIPPELLATEQARIQGIKVDLKELGDEVNKLQAGRAAKPDKGAAAAAREAMQLDLKDLELRLSLARQLAQEQSLTTKQQYDRGDIGDLMAINKELATKLALRKEEVEVARLSAARAGAADKPVKQKEFLNRQTLAVQQDVYDRNDAAEKRKTALDKMARETVAAEAKSLADRGQLVDAFNLEYEAKYGDVLGRVNSDIFYATDAATKKTLIGYRDMLNQMEEDGRNAALGKQLRQQFELGLANLDQALGRVKDDGEGGSLGQMFQSALAAEQALEAALPGLIEKQREMQEQATLTKKPEDQKAATKALKEIDEAASRTRQVWVLTGKAIEKSLGDAFGKSGKAVGQLFTATAAYGAKQKEIQSNLARDVSKDPARRLQLEAKAQEDLASAQMRSYSDMAGAAKGFFSEQSRGYAALEAAQRIFRMAEMAMSVKSMVTQLFATNTVTAAKLTGTALEQTAVVGSVGTVVAAEGAKSTAYGVTALAAALAAPFPANIPAFAAVAAMLAAIGVVVSGGGSRAKEDVSVTRAKANGTGSILGDKDAKSESLAKALENIEDNTYQGLAISMGMLDALRAIQTSMVGLGSLVTQNYGQGTAFGDMSDSVYSRKSSLGTVGSAGLAGLGGYGGALGGMAVAGAMTMGVTGALGISAFAQIGTAVGGVVGALAGAAIGWVASKLFTSKQTLQDQGLSLASQTLGSAVTGGVQGSTYADVQTTKKAFGITYSDKTKRQTNDLAPEIEQQFTLVIQGMRNGVLAAADALGAGGAQFISQLDQFVVAIPEITTKGKTGAEIEEALSNALSKMGDDMARSAFSSLAGFQQAGEGFFETLARLAQDYQAIDVVFQSIGKTFGAVGLGSIAARENLIALSGGLEAFVSQGSYFLENFFTEAEQAAALQARVQPTLSQYGLKADGTDSSMKAFKDFILALDTTTAAGAQAYAQLMPLAPALKSVADAAEKIVDERKDLQDQLEDLMYDEVTLRMKERAALDASNRALYDQVQLAKQVADARDVLSEAYEAEKTTIESTIERLENLGKSWKEFRDSLVMGEASPLTPQQKYLEAQRQFDETVAKAKGGDADAQEKYQSVAQALLDASRIVNATGSAYLTDFDKVLQTTEDGQTWVKQQVDAAKASLDLLKQQVSGLVNIEAGVTSVAAAINSLTTLTMALNRQAGTGQLDQMFQLLLNRAPGDSDRAYWQAKLAEGMSYAQVADAIQKTAEYLTAQARASAAPGSASSAGRMSEINSRGADTAPTAEQVERMIDSLNGLREEQAQQNSDAIDSTAEATLQAAQDMAEAVREAAINRSWGSRAEAYAR